MKRRIQIVGHENMALYPGEYPVANKYVHCVEGGLPVSGSSSAALHTGIVTVAGEDPNSGQRDPQSRVVVEWGPSEHFSGMGALDLLIRYRCGPFPSTGTFYLLIYNDPYQSQLHEVSQSQAWVFACEHRCSARGRKVCHASQFIHRSAEICIYHRSAL
jgi:hypothetical protein